MLLFVYIAQGILLFFDRFLDKKRLLWLMIAGFIIFIFALTSRTLFIFILLFYLVFFSRTCRFSDFGFSYHFTIIVAVGLVYGPIAGLLIGLLPRLVLHKVRPDLQIIDVIIGSVLLTLVGIISGVIGYFSPDIFVTASIILLVVYSFVRFIAMYGKLSMAKTTMRFFFNTALNYYLIMFYLLKLMTLIGYVAPD